MSNEAGSQKERLVTLASAKWPAYRVIFDETEPPSIAFRLQHLTNGRRSGRSVSKSIAELGTKDDAGILRLMQIMAHQCERPVRS